MSEKRLRSQDTDLIKGGDFTNRRSRSATAVRAFKKSSSPYGIVRARSPFVAVKESKVKMSVKRSPIKQAPPKSSLLQPLTATDPEGEDTGTDMEEETRDGAVGGGSTSLLLPRGAFQSPPSVPADQPVASEVGKNNTQIERGDTEKSVREKAARLADEAKQKEREKEMEERNRRYIAQERERQAKEREAERIQTERQEREQIEGRKRDKERREQEEREKRRRDKEKQEQEEKETKQKEQEKRQKETPKSDSGKVQQTLVSLSPFVLVNSGGAKPKTTVPPTQASTPQSSRPPSSSYSYFRPISKTPVPNFDQQVSKEWLSRIELGDTTTPIRRPRSISQTPAVETPFGRSANQSMLGYDETPVTKNPFLNFNGNREDFNYLVRQRIDQLALEEEVEQRAKSMWEEAKELKRKQREEENRRKLEQEETQLRQLEEQVGQEGREADISRVTSAIQRRRMVEQRRQRRRAGEDVDSSTEEESLTGPFRTITNMLGRLNVEVPNPARRRDNEERLVGLTDRNIRSAFRKSLAPDESAMEERLTKIMSEYLGNAQQQFNDRLENEIIYRLERMETNERLSTRALVEKKDEIRPNAVYSSIDASSETVRKAIVQMSHRVKVIEKGTTFNADPFYFAQCVALESNVIARAFDLSKDQQKDLIFSYLPNSVPTYNVLKFNENLEGLLATISTFSTNILTRTALEKKINDWKLNVTSERDMNESFCDLVDMLDKNRDDYGKTKTNIPHVMREAITKIANSAAVPRVVKEKLYEARLKIRDEDSFNECMNLIKAVLMVWVSMKSNAPTVPTKNPRVRVVKSVVGNAKVDGSLGQMKKVKTPKVLAVMSSPPQGAQSTQFVMSAPPQSTQPVFSPKYQNTVRKGDGKTKWQADGYVAKKKKPNQMRGFVRPWPSGKSYLSKSGNKLTREMEAHFENHCHKCGHGSHNADQCLTYKDRAAILTLCSVCSQGFHDVCKSKRGDILRKAKSQVMKQDGPRSGKSVPQYLWSPYSMAPSTQSTATQAAASDSESE